MLIQDSLTGRLHEIPDQLYQSYLGEYDRLYGQRYQQGYGHWPRHVAGQVLYDGLGNPVGIAPLLAMLAPLAAKVLPEVLPKVLPVITKVLPTIAQALPGISSILTGAGPAPAPAEASQPPAAMPPTHGQQFTQSPAAPFQEPMPAQRPAPPVVPQPVQPPAQPVMAPPAPYPPYPMPYPMKAMTAPRMMRGRRRRGHHPIRRRIAFQPPAPAPAPFSPPPPREVMEPAMEERSAEPSGAVQGWGYYGGFNGYRWR